MFNPEQLKVFINSMPGWVVVLDNEGECILYNQAFSDNMVRLPTVSQSGLEDSPFWLQHLQVTDENRETFDVWQVIQSALKKGQSSQHRVQVELLEGWQWARVAVTILPSTLKENVMCSVQFQFEPAPPAHLQVQNQQLEQELGLLKRLQVLLASNVSLEGIFTTVVNASFEIMDHAQVYVVFEEGNTLKLGPSRGGKPFSDLLHLKSSAAAHVIRTGNALHILNATQLPAGVELHGEEASVLGVPFGRSRLAHGALMVESQREPLTHRDLQVLQTVVNHLNIALDTLALHRKVSEDLRRLTALYGVSQAIHQNRSRQGLLEDIARMVQEALSVRWSLIFTLTPNGQDVAYAAGAAGSAPELSLKLDIHELRSGLSGWVMRERKPALSSKEGVDERESPSVRERRLSQQIGAVIVAPLLDPESPRVLGTLTVCNSIHDRDFTEDDVQLVMSVAHQVSVSLSQRELLDRVQRLGKA
ncbi:GAF domain-containing protein [Deinococcus cellulosilyticus]|uniref:GAF domain-containing protein n=1 Tax=Deinococcus cellulosilyticus (strain DSM 18568 / NBRC 106333 / KACC 11606 / 5516J-15) TaxID=1223518 RepID=A0A511N194_DEIC1|nr:GAF domain-containing protein [Deinococcus cellulosilyticus]GEM46228.1 hypothetical protein DC3_18630 [Deinococcus cellulosilyticus NBRC 106333 = KACC 11606]